MFEVATTARVQQPQLILEHEHVSGWRRSLYIGLDGDGVLRLVQVQGGACFEMSLQLNPPEPHDHLRVTYSWDAPSRRAVLSAENLDRDLIFQAESSGPLPFPHEDLREIMSQGAATRFGDDIAYLALSDRLEPVGLSTGLVAGTPVETEFGTRPVERLRLGDLVRVASGGLAPLRWLTKREVPALGHFRPIELRAPYFGLSRPVSVASDHLVLISRAEAEYLFGESDVLVQAADLIDGKAARRLPAHTGVLTYYHLLLDTHECVQSAGLWSETLFVGEIARQPELLASTALGALPASAIPRHRRFVHMALKSFEAHSLTESMGGR
jgi:hypothetical protein